MSGSYDSKATSMRGLNNIILLYLMPSIAIPNKLYDTRVNYLIAHIIHQPTIMHNINREMLASHSNKNLPHPPLLLIF